MQVKWDDCNEQFVCPSTISSRNTISENEPKLIGFTVTETIGYAAFNPKGLKKLGISNVKI